MKVLVDEAWYAHGYFHPELRPCALECGADYVTQSTHKMLSAFSQASMIHVGDSAFDEGAFSRTSEHAHVDEPAVRAYRQPRRGPQADEHGRLCSPDTLYRLCHQLREGIGETGCFRVLTLEDMLPAELAGDGIRLDPTKLTIDVSASGIQRPQNPASALRALFDPGRERSPTTRCRCW
jgi:arginine/lysine/ornithine decarboxylase